MFETVKKFLTENENYIVNLRREFHKYPETEFEEFKTSEIIKRELSEMNISYEDKIAKTGIKAVIKGGKEGRTVLLRADMDALPVSELNDVEYKSTHEGKMHACGHDGHMAVMLAAARALNEIKNEICGNVVLIFRPAEEGQGGAEPMINSGVLENPKPDIAFGFHVEPTYETGSVALKVGGVMASPDEFDIKIIGKGGHGAYREKCVDPIYIASKVITELIDFGQEKYSEESPCVISVGEVTGGSFYNVIPDSVSLKGTSRAVDMPKRELLAEGVKQICKKVCAKYGAECEVDFRFLYPPLVNDKSVVEIMRKSAKENGFEIIDIEKPFMGGDDFAYFAQKIPSAYVYVGCRNEKLDCVYPWHSARFNMDEKCLLNGALIMCRSVLFALGE